MSRTSSPLRLIFVGLIFTFMGGGLLFAALSEVVEMAGGVMRIIGAERMTVEVLDSSVETVTIKATRPRQRDSTYYRPSVSYRYVVDGRAYSSRQVTPLNEHAGRDWASELAGRFKPGQSYQGYYDPDRPAMSFLAAGIHPVKLVIVLFCLTLSALAWYFVFSIVGAFRRDGRPAGPPLDTFAGSRRERRRQRRAAMRGLPRPKPTSLSDFTLDIPDRLNGAVLISVAVLLLALGWVLEHPIAMLIPAGFLGTLGIFMWRLGAPLPPPTRADRDESEPGD